MTRKPWGYVTTTGRAVPTDVLERYSVKAESRQIPEQESFEGVRGLLRPRHDPATLVKILDLSTAHSRACRQKAHDVAGSGWQFEKVDEDASDEGRARLKAFFEALPPPDNGLDDDDLGDVFTAAQLDYESIGRGALEIIREDHSADGPVETIVHMPAHTLRIHRDKQRFCQIKGGQTRWFKWVGADIDVDWRTGAKTELGRMEPNRRATEVVWWKQYHPMDLTYGGPEVLPALGAIHGDLGRRDYNIQFFSNFGIPAYAVFISGDFDPGEMVNSKGEVVEDDSPDAVMTEAEYRISKLLETVRENPHSSLVFTVPTRDGADDGSVTIEFKPLATDVKEASFRLYRRDNREETLSAHGMSAAIAGVFDAGVANRESMTHYRSSIVTPRQTQLERVVNRYIIQGMFGTEGWAWKLTRRDRREQEAELNLLTELHGMSAVSTQEVRGRYADQLNIPTDLPESKDAGVAQVGIPALLEGKVINRNEARVMLGLEPIPGGNTFVESAESDPAVAAALRSMRNDIVDIAHKASGNGHVLQDLSA